MTLRFFHGTDKTNVRKIKELGIEPSYGRFGTCIYSSSNLSEAIKFGDVVFQIEVDMSKIKEVKYRSLKDIYPWLNIDEEEGVTEIEDYVKKLGFSGIRVIYNDGTDELCVYDKNSIQFINLFLTKK